ncbi:predicted protein [Streptomyces pristinaespiralis ATCC 25486]|uniref:Predicted protein n=1 Tax=Streptomyces pristinaespiralis (strain ATCC 25486 / DSM 40338 / CBS 914.69 / JCM 4507 / KCC S-0507 / NBRC 13074 / NRRL 2958 / 5647) TaxID=457429 RepID=D6X8D6_STRE2|nr:predicted protein [Streptomyces pristinaespiralis ATCC 25486]
MARGHACRRLIVLPAGGARIRYARPRSPAGLAQQTQVRGVRADGAARVLGTAGGRLGGADRVVQQGQGPLEVLADLLSVGVGVVVFESREGPQDLLHHAGLTARRPDRPRRAP